MEPIQSVADELARAQARKADAEADAARAAIANPANWRTVLLSNLTGFGSLLLALGTLVGGLVTVGQWIDERAKDRALAVETQINGAVALLASGKPSDHAAAVTTLSSFLDRTLPDRNRRIILTIANAIPSETNLSAQRAMVEFFNALDYSLIDAATKTAALQASVNYDRALTAEAVFDDDDPAFSSADNRVLLSTLSSLATVIARLTMAGGHIRNYSYLFLADADFHGVKFDAPDFSDSILSFADFSNAELGGAVFHNTDIEGTSFHAAHLHGATFDYPSKQFTNYWPTHSTYFAARFNHAQHKFLAQLSRHIENANVWPTFGCADLSGATITGLPIGFYDVALGSARVVPFHDVNFTGTKFDPSFFVKAASNPNIAFVNYEFPMMFRQEPVAYYFIQPTNRTTYVPHGSMRVDLAVNGLFDGSNWAHADAPGWMKAYMAHSSNYTHDRGDRQSACAADADDPS